MRWACAPEGLAANEYGAVWGDESDVAVFLASLSSAWKEGEARPTHRKPP